MNNLVVERIFNPSLKRGTTLEWKGSDKKLIILSRKKTYKWGFVFSGYNALIVTNTSNTTHFNIGARNICIFHYETSKNLVDVIEGRTERKFLEDTVEENPKQYGDVIITEKNTNIMLWEDYCLLIHNESKRITLMKYDALPFTYTLKLLNPCDIIDIVLQTLTELTRKVNDDDLQNIHAMSTQSFENIIKVERLKCLKGYIYEVNNRWEIVKAALCLKKLREVKHRFPTEYEKVISLGHYDSKPFITIACEQ